MVAGSRNPALWPWLLFLATKIAVAILFFGYARLGTLVIPVIAILIGLAIRLPEQRVMKAVAIVLVSALCMDVARVVWKLSRCSTAELSPQSIPIRRICIAIRFST